MDNIKFPSNVIGLKKDILAQKQQQRNKKYLEGSKYLIPKVLEDIKLLSIIDAKNQELTELENKMGVLETEIDQLMSKRNESLSVLLSHKDNTFSFTCPDASCNGLVDTVQCICTLCRSDVCTECISIIKADEVHECSPEMLESVREVLNSSRACPSCKTLINKIEGCTTMYCTQCKTPFNWITGDIVKGSFHNPHADERRSQTMNVDYQYVGSDLFRDIEEKDVPDTIRLYVGFYGVTRVCMEASIEDKSILEGSLRRSSALRLINKVTEEEYESSMNDTQNKLDTLSYALFNMRKIKDVLEILFNMSKEVPKSTLNDIIYTSRQTIRSNVQNILKLHDYAFMLEIKLYLMVMAQ
jgi:hypothetical protein